MASTTLDVIELGTQAVVSDKVRGATRFDLDRHPEIRATLVNAVCSLAGQRFPEKRIEYPADWWQAFRARWFPRWALRRWPVRMTVETWSPAVVYPLIALPEEPRWELLDAH